MSKNISISHIKLRLNSRIGELNIYNLTFAKTLDVASFPQTRLNEQKQFHEVNVSMHIPELSLLSAHGQAGKASNTQRLSR